MSNLFPELETLGDEDKNKPINQLGSSLFPELDDNQSQPKANSLFPELDQTETQNKEPDKPGILDYAKSLISKSLPGPAGLMGNILDPKQPDIASTVESIKSGIDTAKGAAGSAYEALASGSAQGAAALARTPNLIYNVAALPINQALKASGYQEIKDPAIFEESAKWWDSLSNETDVKSKKWAEQGQDINTFVRDGNYKEAGKWLAYQTIKNLPQQVMFVGSAMAGVPAAGLALAGTSSAAQELAEGRERGASPTSAVLNATMNGMIEASFENLGTFGLFKETAKTFGKASTNVFKETIKTLFKNPLGEGAEEFATSLAQDFSRYVNGIDPNAMKGSVGRALAAGSIGTASGAAVTTPAAIRMGLNQRGKINESSTENNVPRGTIIDGKTMGSKTENYLSKEYPQLYEGILNKEIPLEPDQVNDLLFKSAAAGEEVLLKGGTPEQANQAATEAFVREATPLVNQVEEQRSLDRKPQPIYGLTPDIAALQEGRLVESEASKNQPLPQVGIPQQFDSENDAIEPAQVDDSVISFPEPSRNIRIPKKAIMAEAQNLYDRAIEDREGSVSALERFVKDNGGIAPYSINPTTGQKEEREEYRSIPVRLRGTVPYDEMMQKAIDNNILPPDSSYGDLYEQLGTIKKRGDLPRVEDFYDEARRNIEYEKLQEKVDRGEKLPPGIAANYSAMRRNDLRIKAKQAAQKVLSANKIDDRVVVNIVDQIAVDPVAFKEGYGTEYKQDTFDILGATYPAQAKSRIQAVIELAQGATESTGRHEAFHAVSNILLDNNEQSIITNKYGDMEKAADAFGEFRMNSKSSGDSVVDQIFLRIKEFLEKFNNYLSQNKFTTAEDLFKKIDEGRFAERAGTKEYSATPKSEAKFIGYQNFGEGTDPIDLYNVPKGYPNEGSTVSKETLQQMGIPVPQIPTYEDWNNNRTQKRDGTTQYSVIQLDTYDGKKARVIKNPSPEQARYLSLQSPYGSLRYIQSPDGNLYVWDAEKLTHNDVMNELGVETTPQNLEKTGTVGNEVEAAQIAKQFSDGAASPRLEGTTQYSAAYHGSPHVFDKFSLQKIGTGEGNQAYGYGLYFSGKKEVAEYYRDTLSNQTVRYVDNAIAYAKKKGIKDTLDYERAARLLENAKGSLSVALRDTKFSDDPVSEKIIRDVYDHVDKSKGRLYKVDIPDDAEYLDWDKPLEKQSEKVRKEIIPALKKLMIPTGVDEYSKGTGYTGEQLYREVVTHFRQLWENAPSNAEQAASEFLGSLGIPGIKFKDQGSRFNLYVGNNKDNTAFEVRTEKNDVVKTFDKLDDANDYVANQGTSNYVVFDDKLVKILDVQYSAKPNPLKDINVNLFPARQRQPKVYTEKMALRRSLQKQAAAAAQGQIKGIEEVNNYKKALVDIVKEGLPTYERGQFLSRVANLKTWRDLVRATLKLDEAIEISQRKILINSIKRETQRISASKAIALDYKFKVASILNDILFQKPRQSTLARLTELRKYIQSQLSQGKDVGVPNYMLEKLHVLSAKPLSEFKASELEDILGQIQTLADLGKTKLALKKDLDTHNKEKDLVDLAQSASPIRSRPTAQAIPGEKLTAGQNFLNAYADALNKAQSIKLAIMPSDPFFDMLDGSQNYAGPHTRIFKGRVDPRFSNYLDQLSKIKTQLVEKAKGLTTTNMERIGAYATRMQEGGMDKIYNNYGIPRNPVTPDEIRIKNEFDSKIENVKLNVNEMSFYKWMREKLDEVRPEIAETMKNVFNADLGEVKNYFPFVTDYSLMSENDVQDNLLSQMIGLGKTVQKGFTIERTGAGGQKIVLNAFDVFTKHMDDVLYLTNMGETIKYLGELANSQEYKNIVGDVGSQAVREWVDTLAKKGGGLGGQQINFLDKLRVNVGMATLGFKLSSAFIQLTPIGEGATLIGKDAFKGGVDYGTSETWRNFVKKYMPEIRERGGDDPAYKEFISSHGLRARVGEAGYWLLKNLDAYAAGSVAVGAYQKYSRDNNIPVDLNNPNKQALQYAQRIVRRTQASGFFKDLPPAITRGKLTGSKSLDRAIFQFQNFVLNNYSLLTHEGFRAGIAKGNVGQSASVWMWSILMAMAGTGLRLELKELLDFMFGKEDKKEDPFFEKMLTGTVKEMMGRVPFMSQVMSLVGYKSFPVASLDWMLKAGEGIKTAATGKKADTRLRGAGRAAFALARPLGIPGTLQLEEFFKILTSKKKKNRIS